MIHSNAIHNNSTVTNGYAIGVHGSRTVAIKVLPAELALDEERRAMFLKEAKLAASLSHAHIVQVHELGREGDLDFIVMEYIEGQALSNVVKERIFSPDKVADIGLQIAQGLAQAHRRELIHRDLKPANISNAMRGWKLLRRCKIVVPRGLRLFWSSQLPVLPPSGSCQSGG